MIDISANPDAGNNQLGNNRLTVLADEIREGISRYRKSAEEAAAEAIKVGNALIEAKQAVGHGGWMAWLKENCQCSGSTARRFMRIAESGLELSTVANLGIAATDRALAKPRERKLILAEDVAEKLGEFEAHVAEALAIRRETVRKFARDISTAFADLKTAGEIGPEWVARVLASVRRMLEALPGTFTPDGWVPPEEGISPEQWGDVKRRIARIQELLAAFGKFHEVEPPADNECLTWFDHKGTEVHCWAAPHWPDHYLYLKLLHPKSEDSNSPIEFCKEPVGWLGALWWLDKWNVQPEAIERVPDCAEWLSYLDGLQELKLVQGGAP